MKVDRQQFLSAGYLIIRECIPPRQLEQLRQSFAVLIERQKEIWRRERKADDPPDGHWETAPQPRLWFDTLVDEKTIDTVEFCLHQNAMGVSQQLLCAPDAALLAMFMLCSPVRDHGPAKWHRDLHPVDQAPLRGLQADMLENAPGLVQWIYLFTTTTYSGSCQVVIADPIPAPKIASCWPILKSHFPMVFRWN